VSAEQSLFYAFSGLALLSALGVLANVRNTVNAALCLMVSMVAIAGLFVMLHAEFLGVLQVLVYAGAIVVLFVFVIMLLNLRGGIASAETHFATKLLGGALLVGVAVKLTTLLAGVRGPWAPVERGFGTVAEVGRVLFTDYVLAVEAAGVLLLAGIVAAVILAKRELD
jgi:NADH-quinone oxidoreductase subunit J